MRGRVGTPQRAMHIYYGTSLYNIAIVKSWLKKLNFSKNEVAKFRLEVINFYNWDITSLIPKSRAPKNKRKMEASQEVIEFIRRIRKEHPRLGKEKIKPLLDEYCKKIGIKTVSASTIGKIINRYNMFYKNTGRYYHNPDSKWAKRRRNYRSKVKRSPKEKEPGYIEVDSIVKFIDGIKVYIINAIDVKTKFVFSEAYRSLSSNNALDFFKKLEMVYPYELEMVYPYERGIRIVQTDNGSEFMGSFDKYLRDKGIEHRFTYPRSPKINGYIERFNRSIQEEFLEDNIYLIHYGIEELNKGIIDYIIWYNTKRAHKSLGYLSPIDYILKYYPESQMSATYTPCVTFREEMKLVETVEEGWNMLDGYNYEQKQGVGGAVLLRRDFSRKEQGNARRV